MQLITLSDKERLDWLRLYRSENVGSKTFFDLLKLYKSAEVALQRAQGMSIKGGRKKPIKLCSIADAKQEIEDNLAIGSRIITYCEPEFPALLRQIKDCPPLLSMLGNTELLKQNTIAIVGARNSSANGCIFAKKMAEDLGRSHVVCASGLARGIDTAVHQGSLNTGTIAVVASGINVVYPKENDMLYKAIAERGLVIAEAPFGAQPLSKSFPRRNRIISGISHGTVVVEASFNSGSLITARMALEQGRDVFAVPGSPLDPRCRGSNDLLRHGAILTEDVRDVLNHVNFDRLQQSFNFEETESTSFVEASPHIDEPTLDRARPEIIQKMGTTPVGINDIISQLGIASPIVLTVLLELELAGRLERHSGNRVSLLYSGETELLFA